MNKKIIIPGAIIGGFILLIVAIFWSTNNTVVAMEEDIYAAESSISIQEKARIDKIYNLVDSVESYNDYESGTLTSIVEARQGGDNGEATKILDSSISVIAEQYPELKSANNYETLMKEISQMENIIAQQRENLNNQIREYNTYIRTMPASMIVGMMGYEPIDVKNPTYDAPSDAPQNLFD